jgi:VIT1/CCC1 family predicted Fe2+/Mn2+ transporter
MDPRPILLAAFLLVVVLAGLTIYVAIRNGPDVLTVLSTMILAMLGFGIFGALREPPR